MKESLHRGFGSSLSLRSSSARSLTRDASTVEGFRTSLSSNMALPRLSVAEVLSDSGSGEQIKLIAECLYAWNCSFFMMQIYFWNSVKLYWFISVWMIRVIFYFCFELKYLLCCFICKTDVLSSQKLFAVMSPNEQQKLRKTFSTEDVGASSSAEAGAVESLSYELMHFLCF